MRETRTLDSDGAVKNGSSSRAREDLRTVQPKPLSGNKAAGSNSKLASVEIFLMFKLSPLTRYRPDAHREASSYDHQESG